MDWENTLEKNPIQKIEKIVKTKVKLPHVSKKPLARKRIFVQTQFFHSTLKLERTKFTPQNHSRCRSTSCFGVTKITTGMTFISMLLRNCPMVFLGSSSLSFFQILYQKNQMSQQSTHFRQVCDCSPYLAEHTL